MKPSILFKKFLSLFLIFSLLGNIIVIPSANAVSTNGTANPWTMEKAEHLAKRALIGSNPTTILNLYNAGSATAAVNLLFPSVDGPDRTAYNAMEDAFKWVAFNPSDTNAMRKLYTFRYYADPYEAKRKLFWLFEDIFPIDRTGVWVSDINFPDIENHFNVLFSETLGNYKNMVRKIFFDTSKPENSFAMGRYLDLLNQPDKNYPNENYARELMQLFLMLEYKPWEDAESTGAVRNYTEADVAALAKLISWFRAWDDKKVYFDMNFHNTGATISFLTGALKSWDSFPFYNTASGTIDNSLLPIPRNGNNGVADNILDYIFSKREAEIADFLAWRFIKYYIKDKPTQGEIELVANQIITNNFNIYPTIKWLLASNMMYSEEAMNSQKFKTPLELTVGTLKLLHYKDSSIVDGLLSDTSLLSNLDWKPYNPGSIFWRSGFDDNANFMNAYFHNQWSTYASKIAFTTGTGYYNLADMMPITRNNTGTIAVKTHSGNTYSGSIKLSNISVTINQNAFPFVSTQSLEAQDIWDINSELSQSMDWTQSTQTGSQEQTESTQTSSDSQNSSSQTNTWTDNQNTKEETSSQRVTPEKVVNELLPESQTPIVSPETSTSDSPSKLPEATPLAPEDNWVSSILFPKAYADIVSANTITFATWEVVLPEFYILTSSGNKIYLEWNYNLDTNNLSISSGSITYGTGNYTLSGASFTIDAGANLQRDITIDEMITQLEDYLYFGKRLPESVKTQMKNYLLKTDTGADRLFLPNNTTYRNKYIRAIIAMMLVQPEFMMQSGFDTPTTQLNTWNTPINNANSKLVMVELYGWYDWMNGIIPKSDFAYYQDIRKELSITGSNLIDLGSVYMNKSLEALKPLYDNGELRIVNRVWAPNHSRGHDTAAIQIASQKGLQTVGTPWLIWELIKNETNPLNHIVLWTENPPIYTNGRYINIWGSSILYKNNTYSTTTAEKAYQMNTLRNVLNARNYPGTSSSVFKSSITLDDVARSWQESMGWTLSGRLNFTKNLMDNGLGITYYVWWWGWYDTHGDQLKTGTWVYNLNDRTRDLAQDVVWFFNKVKASGKEITIVIYSEFWRTLETNGSIGTDHGEWGWYFILTTNPSLKTALPNKVIGKISPEKEYEDWFGVGIDYRSIFSRILSSLYNIDTTSYFFKDYNLDNDLNTRIPNPILFRQEYSNSWGNNMNVDIKFGVDDSNFIFRDGSYIIVNTGTDPNNLKQYNRWYIDNYTYNDTTNTFKLNFNLTQGTKYYYNIQIVDNQYDSYVATGSFLVPTKITNVNQNQISLTADTYFSKYDKTQVSWVTDISKIVLYNNPVDIITSSGSTGTGSSGTGVSYSGSLKTLTFTGGVNMTFGTGETSVSQIFSSSWAWNGWFILPKILNKDEFLADDAYYKLGNIIWGKLKTDFSIDSIVKIGADVNGIGMKLNQKVGVSIPVNNVYDDYTILTSEDGLVWTDLANANTTFTWGKVSFTTDHFSYFAVTGMYNAPSDTVPDRFSFDSISRAELNTFYSSNIVTISGIDGALPIFISDWEYSINGGGFTSLSWMIFPWNKLQLRGLSSSAYNSNKIITVTLLDTSVSFTIKTKSSWWWSSGWWWSSSWWSSGWWWLTKDKCPNGDYSPSYYDKTCWIKSNISSKPVLKDKAYYQALKQKILQDRINAHKAEKKTVSSIQNSKKISKVKYNNFEIFYVKGYPLSDKTKLLALKIVNSKKLTWAKKTGYIIRVNEYLEANYNYDFAINKTRELKNKVIKQEILLKWVIRNIQ